MINFKSQHVYLQEDNKTTNRKGGKPVSIKHYETIKAEKSNKPWTNDMLIEHRSNLVPFKTSSFNFQIETLVARLLR